MMVLMVILRSSNARYRCVPIIRRMMGFALQLLGCFFLLEHIS